MLSWIARRIQAALDMLRAWSSRHAFGITITLLIVAFFAIFFWERIFVSIYAGHVGVLWRRFGGTVVDRVYGEGLHFVLPFNIMYVYDVRWAVVRRSIVALTQDGLDMTVTLSILYRVNPPLAGELHQRVGMGYVESLITPTVAGVVDFFERDLIERLKEEVQIGWHYIEVADVNVERLVMPETVQAAITGELAPPFSSLEQRIEAILELARSPNAKVIVLGDKADLPLLIGTVPLGQDGQLPTK